MKTANDFQDSQAFALLLVGEPKSGKTNVAMSFPAPWVLNIDRNIANAANKLKGHSWYWDDPYTNEAGQELPPERWWDRSIELLKQAAVKPEIKTLILDGGGALADMLIYHIIHRVKLEEGKTVDRLRIQDYQPLANALTRLIVLLRNCGKFIIFTFHQKVDKDEHTGRIRYELNMPGKLAASYGGYFTDVWACVASNAPAPLGFKYELHTKPTGYHITLGTSRDLPPVLDVTNKTPPQIWAMIGPKILQSPGE